MGLGTQTSLLRSLEGKGGGVLISHCFWPDQHTPSPVKGPPAVYNFQELDKPLDQRERFHISLSLRSKASGCTLPSDTQYRSEIKHLGSRRALAILFLQCCKQFAVSIKTLSAAERSKCFNPHERFTTTAVVSIFKCHINAGMQHKICSTIAIVTI